MKARCANCPGRGCEDCPMFGIGLNPAFKKREEERLEREAKGRMKAERESAEKSIEL